MAGRVRDDVNRWMTGMWNAHPCRALCAAPDGRHDQIGPAGVADMSRRPRRNHSPAFKEKVALAAVKSDRTIAQLAEHFDVHCSQITAWKSQLEGLRNRRWGAKLD